MKVCDFSQFSGYILAGGKSSRMGRDKAFLKINGKTFAQNALEILQPICAERIKFVIDPAQSDFPSRLPAGCIYDIHPNNGPLGGIHAALNDCKTEFAIIFAVDFPFVTTEIFQQLAIRISKTSASILVPENGNQKQPLCAIYRANSVLPSVLHSRNDSAARSRSVLDFVAQSNGEFLEIVSANFDNINRPADLPR